MGSAEMMQAVQLMLAQMQTQNMDNMAIFAKQQNDMMLAMMQQSRAGPSISRARSASIQNGKPSSWLTSK